MAADNIRIEGYQLVRADDVVRCFLEPWIGARASIQHLKISDIDVVELNEAFGSQSVACVQKLGIANDRVNKNGGAIALGHPLGCSGARILTTLLHAMEDRDVAIGLATLCVGVGQGSAMIIER